MEIDLDDLILDTFNMTALFDLEDAPLVAANDEEYPEYENLYGTPA